MDIIGITIENIRAGSAIGGFIGLFVAGIVMLRWAAKFLISSSETAIQGQIEYIKRLESRLATEEIRCNRLEADVEMLKMKILEMENW